MTIMNLAQELELHTDVASEIQHIAYLLDDWGCCARCVLRFLGEKQHIPYKFELQVIKDWVQGEVVGYKTANNIEPTKVVTDDESTLCVVCLGLLQEQYCSESFIKQIGCAVADADYDFKQFVCALYMPVSTLIREYAIWILLEENVNNVYKSLLPNDDLPQMKDVWKFVNVKSLESTFNGQMKSKSMFEASVFFINPDVEKECNFLLDLFPEVFVQRKKCNERWQVFNNTNVAKALTELSDRELRRNFQCPPRRVRAETTLEKIECYHGPIHIAGRYNKYSRLLSQTPWVIEGVKKSELSVEEIIDKPIRAAFRYSEERFASSGREDVDVRMLGRGRPFVLEILDPHRVFLSPEELQTIQQAINASSSDVQVRDLQIVTREDTFILKKGELEKKKTYSALCWCENEVNKDLLEAKINRIQDLVIHQKTPIRVLHRRNLSTRPKTIHNARAELVDEHHFRLYLTSQAGTYIKEFVHGDFGRTSPNMCELLDGDCDILELDVEDVDLDWPKTIEAT